MKKMLMACAAVATLVPAMAQESQVTVYGVMDTGLSWGNGSLTSIKRVTNSNWSSTRWGFRGTEDLGGGMKAFFVLEGAVNTDDGTGANTNTNNQANGTVAGLFGRVSYVGLSGGFGDIRLGRDFAPHHMNITLYDPWLTVGVAGNAVHAARAAGLGGWGAHSNPSGVRVSNQVEYRSPNNWGGFFLHGSHYLGENPSAPAAAADDGTGSSVRVGYNDGPLNVAVAVGKTRYGQTATAGDATFQNIGGSYTWNGIKIGALYANDRFNTLTPYRIEGWMVALSTQVGAFQLRSSYSTSQRTNTNNAANPSVHKLGVGVGYDLSKRTNLYVNLAHLKNRGGSSVGLGGSTTAANTSSTGVDMGIKHAF